LIATLSGSYCYLSQSLRWPKSVGAEPWADVVMVLPFENTSNRAEYNWVGESFADALAELLNKPGLIVISSDERELAYQRLRLPKQ
jgi:TolB-like protein